MALTTPILNQISAFDSSVAELFTFNVVGGSQVISNRLVVSNNSTGVVVYNAVQTTFKFEHTLPANTLTNGVYYTAKIQTIDASGATSLFSTPIQFFCFTNPVLQFTNMPSGNVIQNSSFDFGVIYTQIQNELLNSYSYNLYNLQNTIVATSGTLYVNSTVNPPTNLSYIFSGFDDNASYFIECAGQTVNGTSVTTGRVQFFVKYEKPTAFTVLSLANNMCDGYVTIQSNIVAIDGVSNPSPPIYIGNDSVDLRADGSYVKWIEGYNLTNDFTIRIWGRDFKDFSNILKLRNKQDSQSSMYNISINFNYGYLPNDNQKYAYIDMYVYSGNNTPYYTYSNYIPYPAAGAKVFMWLRRINNFYELRLDTYT